MKEEEKKLDIEGLNKITSDIDGLIKVIEPFKSQQSDSAINDLTRVIKGMTELYTKGVEKSKPLNTE